MSKLKVSC